MKSLPHPMSYLPCDPDTLLIFVQHLHNLGLAPASIKTRIAAVGFMHKICRLPNPSNDGLVFRSLQGISRMKKRLDKRIPVSPRILRRLLGAAEVLEPHYVAAMAKAIFSLMFSAFLRVGEITDSHHNLGRRQFQFSKKGLTIQFQSFKHSNTRKPAISIPPSGGKFCTVRLVREYCHLRDARGTSGPFFLSPAGLPLTKNWVRILLHKTCRSAGIDPRRITPHSFRIGAATWAAAAGKSLEQIRLMGRWASNAAINYIRVKSLKTPL